MKPETFGRDATLITLVVIMITLVLAFISISIPITSAVITELNVEPEVVDPGEVITISGMAAQGEEVWLGSSFELSLPVSDGKYCREFDNLHFPKREKKFSVRAENIKNIQASLCCVFWQTVTITCSGQNMTIAVPGTEKTSQLPESIDETGCVSFSISFPVSIGPLTLDISGKKDVNVEGDAAEGATSVDLKITTSIKVNADSNGNFSLDLDTEGVPEGKFLISAEGTDGEKIEETVYIGVTPTPSPSPSPSPSPTPSPTPTPSSNGGGSSSGGGSGGGGGGGGSVVPDTTPTPTQAMQEKVTTNETATPTPASTPTLIPTLIPASTTAPPQITPIKNENGHDKGPRPIPQDKTSQSPQKTTEPSRIPGFGFEAIGCIAIAALITVIIRREGEGKRRKI